MRLTLGGHLRWYAPERLSRLELVLDAPRPLAQLLESLGVPPAEVAVTLVNGRRVRLEDAIVIDPDEVRLYPPVGGGSWQAPWVRLIQLAF